MSNPNLRGTIRVVIRKAAILGAIRALRTVPSDHLYASVNRRHTLDEYQTIISDLKESGLIEETGNHLLVWIEPK